MKFSNAIKKFLPLAFLVGALVLGVWSLFVPSSAPRASVLADQLSNELARRTAKLDDYSSMLLYSPSSATDWPSLKKFPDDMVIYKYADDTLHSWHNRFSVTNDDLEQPGIYSLSIDSYKKDESPLVAVDESFKMFRFGGNSYLCRMREKGDVKLIEGLLLQDENGPSRSLKLHVEYDIHDPASEECDAVVRMNDSPLFGIRIQKGSAIASTTLFSLRWTAVILLVLALMSYLFFHRSARVFSLFLLLLSGITILAKLWAAELSDVSLFFSPLLYYGGPVMSSFASVVILNTFIAFASISFFLCRKDICRILDTKWKCAVALSVMLSCIVCSAWYTIDILKDLMVNSTITMELFRFTSLSFYTVVAYLSFTSVFLAILLMLEVFVEYSERFTGKKLTLLTHMGILSYAIVTSLIICFIIEKNSSKREAENAAIWGEMLSMDRNLDLEMRLVSLDAQLSKDPMIEAMLQLDNAVDYVSRRLEEMYFSDISREYNVRATIFGEGFDPLAYTSSLNEPYLLEEGSNFIYENNPLYGCRYIGLYEYKMGVTLMIEISPRPEAGVLNEFPNTFHAQGSISIPPYYSYAKYYDRKLCSFRGRYAYPTVQDSMIDDNAGSSVIVADGYTHYVFCPDSREVVVISRPHRNFISYFVLFSLVVLLIYLQGIIFKPHHAANHKLGSFNTRIKYLIAGSLFVTLIVMAGVSVWFVYNRNERNLSRIMSSRISAVQVSLDSMAKNMDSIEEFTSPQFAAQLNNIARTSNTDIVIYSPAGRRFASTDRNIRDANSINSRLDPEAFKSIVLRHQRYYIRKGSAGLRPLHQMYCQISNAKGELIGIACVPYIEQDYDFSRDAVFHAVTMLSLFLFLLFITIFLATSITQKIFSPLLEMSRKMNSGKANQLELISYKGRDEITDIVDAYNAMVVDLQASTKQLALAERDKAWSEMARQVAHEIKNPLTPIKLEIQRLIRLKQKNDPSWEGRFDEVAQVVLEHIDILSQTANEFSTFAKLYSEEPVEIDLDKVLQDQVMLFAKDIEMTYLGTPSAVMYGPKPQIIRVFVNLLSNAVQAVDGVENPKVLVSLRRSSDMDGWDIAIEDNGPGVDAKNQQMLFTPNFTTKSSGTGLGLAICRSIVDRCGGTIKYSKSFSLGGACFTVCLPCSNA